MLLALGLLSACGSTKPAALAVVGNTSIDRSDVAAYTHYATRFYQSSGVSLCHSRPCSGLSRQVLGRLIQERVATLYARHHHLSLSSRLQRTVTAEVHLLTSDGLSWRGLSLPLIHSIVKREMLILQIEQEITPHRLLQGESFQVERYFVPEKIGHREASLLANGRAGLAKYAVRKQWLAAWRLPPPTREALRSAPPGDTSGTFAAVHGWVIYRLLNRGIHPYHGPARRAVEAKYFKGWLRRQVHRAHPTCYRSTGARTRCPLPA
ncbi:MAG: hypothetical protein ACRDFS_06225 [Chloroflexota bacterium]